MMTTQGIQIRLIGQTSVKLWGMGLDEWQARAWRKAGAAKITAEGRLLSGVEWVFSPALQRALMATPGAALVTPAGERGAPTIAAIHLPEGADEKTYADLINTPCADTEALRAMGLTPGGVTDFAGSYNIELRKRENPYAISMQVSTPHDVEKLLFKGSYKGVTDLVTKYAWPIPAFHVTRWAAQLQLTPNAVTTASLGFVLLAMWCFWIGAWLPGIAAAWAMTFLDTVDGKLARTTMTYSKWGNIYDHGIDLIHPPFWYWAIYHGLTRGGDAPNHELLTVCIALIIIGYVLNRIEEGVFLARFKFHIHVWRPVDSFAREITARRNPNMLIFMLAVFVGQPASGFVAIAGWTIFWLGFHGVRLVQALTTKAPVVSWMDA